MPIYNGTQNVKPLGFKEAYFGSALIYKTSRLPSTYQEVEYIESQGAQYIDTGIKPNQNTNLELDFSGFSSSSVCCLFGGQDAAGYWELLTVSSNYRMDWENQQISRNIMSSNRQELTINGNTTTIGNTTITFTSASWQNNITACLFARNNSGSITNFAPSGTKIYYCKMSNGSTPLRELIPCYRKADSEIGLYDLVNNVFYTNQGSGSFIKGNDV